MGTRNQLKVNGKRLFLNGIRVDGRSPVAQQFKMHFEGLTAQLGADLTPAQDMLARRAARIATECDIDDALTAAGEDTDGELYLKRTNSLTSTLKTLGMARIPRDITPKPRDRSKPKPMDAHTAALIDQGDD